MRRVAIVTGASRGIGESICQVLAGQGFDLALIARGEAELEAVAGRVARDGGGRALAFPCDLSDPAQADVVFGAVVRRMGDVPAVLVNNAGHGGPFVTVDRLAPSDWRSILALNLDAAQALIRLALPGMVERSFGRIVNISSIYGFLGGAGSGAYAAAKHGLLGLTRTVAAEWGHRGVTCNAVCPGFVDTPMLDELKTAHPDALAAIVAEIPASRLGRPDEVAGLVAYLVSDGAGYINGAAITMDGGLSCHVRAPAL